MDCGEILLEANKIDFVCFKCLSMPTTSIPNLEFVSIPWHSLVIFVCAHVLWCTTKINHRHVVSQLVDK